MFKKILVAIVALGFMSGPAFAVKMPSKYKKCKACHGLPTSAKGKVGPNLSTSTWKLEQWIKQVNNGSKWDCRPDKQKGYEKKKMKKIRGYSDADIKEIYDYVQASKK